jgi:predicted AAA+ superfamily ATPase
MINRTLEDEIKNKFYKGKIIILIGPRQSGKTTLINKILKNIDKKVLSLDGEEFNVKEQLKNPSSEKLKLITGDNEIVFIDEAQKIKDIGSVLKLFHDKLNNVQVIATGSSSFELLNKTGEPLTGRKYEFTLYPFSFSELLNNSDFITENSKLESRLIYGSYPEIVTNPSESEELLKLLSKSYLFKDLFSLDNINNPEGFETIVRALALQIGSEVSYKEIANTVGMNKLTVDKYIKLLERAFIVFKLPAYSKNIRNEIRKGKKYYFYDNGIRNAVIGNFNLLENRNDIGALWENYLVSERMKYLVYKRKDYRKFFWRTTQQQEIDYIEEISGEIFCYEFKWSKKAKARFSKTFTEKYLPKQNKLITKENYYEFLMDYNGTHLN